MAKPTLKELAMKEQATRELEKRFAMQRNSLYEFMCTVREKEYKKKLDDNWHIREICAKLEAVYRGEIKRLIINIPPRTLKTEIVSINFPAWVMGNKQDAKFMEISYASGLAEENSNKCRSLYKSSTYNMIFPRRSSIRLDQDTKQYWVLDDWGSYYASGSTGTITGKGCDIMIIDDPMKPGDADSDLVRTAINNNFHDTLESRLNDKTKWAIIVIMQRLHDDDLTGHLLDLESRLMGDRWEKLIIPAISEIDEQYREKWESFFQKRFPIKMLREMQTNEATRSMFATQYQQSPTNKETQEFHDEWYRYHGAGTACETPKYMRIFTTVDPAFKQWQDNDNTAIVTWGFHEDKLYLLEYSVGKWTADVALDKIMYHMTKRKPEKVGVEAFQAQSMIITFLKNEMNKRAIYIDIEEVRQTGDKLSKIRSLIPYYRRGLIYHTLWMQELENEERKFPRGKHDDIVDAVQMLYNLYELQPNIINNNIDIRMERDALWRPVLAWFNNNDLF